MGLPRVVVTIVGVGSRSLREDIIAALGPVLKGKAYLELEAEPHATYQDLVDFERGRFGGTNAQIHSRSLRCWEALLKAVPKSWVSCIQCLKGWELCRCTNTSQLVNGAVRRNPAARSWRIDLTSLKAAQDTLELFADMHDGTAARLREFIVNS